MSTTSTPKWITPAGSVGTYPASISMEFQLVATNTSNLPITYSLISGHLPTGLSFRVDGLISGTPEIVIDTTTHTFVVRATEPISGQLVDRTFEISISGTAIPTFTTPGGSLLETVDSVWVEIPIEYNNPIPENPISIRVIQGSLPAGLEINEYGLIRGYPKPPVLIRNLGAVSTLATATDSTNNSVTLLSTLNLSPGRLISFYGTPIGNLIANGIYYIKSVIDATQITLCDTPNGPTLILDTGTGFMDVSVPATQIGEPTKRQNSFVLEISSPLGSDTELYTMTIINFYLPTSQGGPTPSNSPNTRPPTIYNTRPFTYYIEDDVDYGYFVLPAISEVSVPGETYEPTQYAYIGQFLSDDYMAFKIIGHDFDGNNIRYNFSELPVWLNGNVTTGWIYGIPSIPINDIEEYEFKVLVQKDNGISTLLTASIPNATSTSPIQVVSTDDFGSSGSIIIGLEVIEYTGKTSTTFTGITRGAGDNPATAHSSGVTVTSYTVLSPTFSYSFRVANNINGYITWITDSDLGTIYNATNCYKIIEATSDVPLIYDIIDGELPPNLFFNTENGQIEGIVSYQPVDTYSEENDTNVFTFTIKAYNPDILNDSLEPLVTSEKTFTLTIEQYFNIPTDNLYIKCTPSLADRDILRTLLNDEGLIPADYLYREDDANFGKATSVIYAHAYGIYSSTLDQYIEAVKKNHYWRNITLGELNTAIAKDENTGEILYEVVYSTIIDNLQKYNPNFGYDYRYSESIPEDIYWPRFINLNLGPWYANRTNIFSSYVFYRDGYLVSNLKTYDLLTQFNEILMMQEGVPTFYTSLTPGFARLLYPNSLENMRKRVSQELGADYNYKLLPLWMTSQQNDGNTLGFTPAWVICYTKPPVEIALTADVTYKDINEIEVSSVENLQIGGQIIFSGNVFGGIVAGVTYYIISIYTLTNRIKISTSIHGSELELSNAVGVMSAISYISYAQIIKNNIETDWAYTLNKIDFKIDRFSVNKQITYNYDVSDRLDPDVWTRFPSATPTPEPIDSENFYVLFPQKTILPSKTQYNL